MNFEEAQYLTLIDQIIEKGVQREDRTGTGTRSIFGAQMRFSLEGGSFPLITTKEIFFRGIVEELLWFVRGSTNARELHDKHIYIWDKHCSREYLDSKNLHHLDEGDLGPIYGFQWRHFGAKYVNMYTDYSGQGVDQLAYVIEMIKNHPEDRRIIMSAWNPNDLSAMALPPCHCFVQFYVANGKLSCQLYQRSCDIGLGCPFNIASYSLLCIMLAHITNLEPGEFIHTLGDTHVYIDHIDVLKKQCQRIPYPFPKIRINRSIKNIDEFTVDDFTLLNYNHHSKLYLKVAV